VDAWVASPTLALLAKSTAHWPSLRTLLIAGGLPVRWSMTHGLRRGDSGGDAVFGSRECLVKTKGDYGMHHSKWTRELGPLASSMRLARKRSA